ncbi:NUDIX hydrolase [Candidatus Micrarchaeota archaeon]|nr:NUDIX hydrolase [Candidatus Micrarchaeota archaeon]
MVVVSDGLRPRPAVVDAVVFNGENEVLLVKRGTEPFKGWWAIPGGFMEFNETAEQAVAREVKEETGLDVKVKRLLGVYSSPERDVTRQTVACVFICEPIGGTLKGGDDAVEAKWFSLEKLPPLGFDHPAIIKNALEKIRK